jgi:hypothetical protein
MSDAANNDRRSGPPRNEDGGNEDGVLANLPRTRPQRSSPRRAAERNAKAAGTAETVVGGAGPNGAGAASVGRARKPVTAKAPAGKRRKTTAKRPRTSAPRRAPGPADDAVPRQGFESDSDAASGSVQPPGGAELVTSAAEIVGELAKAGLSTGERLLKDVLSRLPFS